MQTTTNYGLKKPGGDDFYNVEDFNENADLVDENIKSLSDRFAGCWLSFTDEDGNATDVPYVHWIDGQPGDYAPTVVSPFRLGIDENGNCGYIKPGEDTVTPFGSGGGSTARTVGAIEQLQMAKITGLTSEVTVELVTE